MKPETAKQVSRTPGPWWERQNSATMRDFNRLKEEATELLEAAKSATDYFQMLEDKTGVVHPVLRDLRSAIAKAEGRE